MNKTINKIFLSSILLVPLFMSGCSSNNVYYNLECSGTVYSHSANAQELTISVSASTENPVTFKESISASDVSFSLQLGGFTASSVTYLSSTSIKVSLTGSSITSSESYGRYDIKPSGITSGDTCFGLYNKVVTKANIYSTSNSFSKSDSVVVRAATTFEPCIGTFVTSKLTSENIVFSHTDGEMAINYAEDGSSVSIVITNWTIPAGAEIYPVISFKASTWSFGLSVDNVRVGHSGSYDANNS